MSDELENEQLKALRELAKRNAMTVSTHAADCWKYHFPCGLGLALDQLESARAELASLRARPQEPGLSKERVIRLIESRIAAEKVVERNCDIKCCNPRSDGPANHWGIQQGLLYAIEEIESLAPSGPLSDEPRELEWRIDECPGEAPAWRMKDWWVQGDVEGAWECFIDNDTISFTERGLTFDAAKSLAARLQSVLDGRPL